MAVNLSPVGGVAAQFFTNTGAVLTGGKLYTYLAGTTTPEAAYTTSAGNIPWTNPIVLDAAGRVSGSGEIWLTDGIIYKFVLKDSNDVLIATYDNITGINSNSVAYTNQQEIITATAGQTVFNLSISYQPGTNSLSVFVDGVNQYGPGASYAYTETDSNTVTFVSGLHVGAEVKFTTTQQQGAGAVDASQVSYTPAGTGAVTTNVQAKLRQTVSVMDFGAVGDGTTNDAPAFNAAILYCALAGGGKIVAPYATYKLSTTVIVPSNIEIDLCSSLISGSGIGGTNDVFQTGYLSGSTILTNIGTANESHLVLNTQIKNGRIQNTGKAFNLFNFLWGSALENITFQDCTYAVQALRCFYGTFQNLTSRGTASGATNAAFYFGDFVNVENIIAVSASERVIGIKVYGAANGQKFLSCTAENCDIGIEIDGAAGPFELDSCYIESCSVTGVNIKNASVSSAITISNTWFNNCATGVAVDANGVRLYVNDSNTFLACTTNIDNSNQANSLGRVVIQQTSISNSGYPSITAGFTLSNKVEIEQETFIIDSSTGNATVKANVYGGYLVPFEFDGNSGTPVSNTVPFCVHSKSAGTSFSVYVDTKIAWQPLTAMLAYRLQVVDNINTYNLYGMVFGDVVQVFDATGKTVTATNSGGFLRLTISTFSSPTEAYSLSGVLRHI